MQDQGDEHTTPVAVKQRGLEHHHGHCRLHGTGVHMNIVLRDERCKSERAMPICIGACRHMQRIPVGHGLLGLLAVLLTGLPLRGHTGLQHFLNLG